MPTTALHPSIEMIDRTVFPATVRFKNNTPVQQLSESFHLHEAEFEELLREQGAILFSGLAIESREDFENTVRIPGKNFANYVDGNSPRTKLSDVVYTSTEFDPAQTITMHNELSYSSTWPARIFFSCIKPSETGGETPLADGRSVLQKLDQTLVNKVRAAGVIYYRNLHGGDGFGPSWQDTFETNSREEVEDFCKKADIIFEWVPGNAIRLVQKRQGIVRHPGTGQEVWFNQMDQFHPSQMGDDIYEVLMSMYGEEKNLPTYVTYGDGSPIDKKTIQHIKSIFDEVSVARPWNKGDLVLVDNVLVSHGRKPYTGDRKILVAMMK
ncbi:MAG: TauD/TfdA family dioxygenase [Chitinophagaceae bacterium]